MIFCFKLKCLKFRIISYDSLLYVVFQYANQPAVPTSVATFGP